MIVIRIIGLLIFSYLFADYVWGDYQPSRWFVAFLLAFAVIHFITEQLTAWLDR